MSQRCRPRNIVTTIVLLTLSAASQADLESRDLDGDPETVEAVYDTDRDITWLANSRALSLGSAFDDSPNDIDSEYSDGLLSYGSAVSWAESLTVGGASDWRLPTTADPDANCSGGSSTVSADGYGCTGGEMGHLFYDELGGTAGEFIERSTDAGVEYFSGWYSREYWSGTSYAANPDYAWRFDFGNGYQSAVLKSTSRYQPVLAVRDGDIGNYTPEICDNGVDDDGDGLIDGQDYLDCFEPTIGLNVQCLHEPLYPQVGDQVTVRARTIDGDGNPVDVDLIEIYINDQASPHTATNGSLRIEEATAQANGEQFSYSCLAQRNQENAFSEVISVDVGAPEMDYPAVPVIYRGKPSEKIDLVFFPEVNTYPGGASDPQFEEDLRLMLRKGLFEIPWYLTFQDYFNVWIGTDTAGISTKSNDRCKKEKPDGFKKRYSFANAVGVIHDVDCRDNAGAKLFSTTLDLRRLQVLAHEIGHSAYSLPDEYCCDGGYYPLPEKPSLFLLEANCRFSAEERGYDPANCRRILTDWPNPNWWIFELRHNDPDHPLPRPHDVMQGTGCVSPRQPATEDPQCDFREADLSGPDQDPNGVVACDFRVDTYRGDPDGVPYNDDDRYWLCTETGSAAGAVWTRWSDRQTTNVFGDTVPRPIESYHVGPSERGRMIWKLGRCRAGKC